MSEPDTTLPADRKGGPGVPILQQKAERLLGVVEPAAAVARGFAGFFGGLSLLSALAGLMLFILIFAPFSSVSMAGGVGMGVVLILLLLPGAVLGLFRLGLWQLIGLPSEAAAALGNVEVRSLDAIDASRSRPDGEGRVARLVRFVRSLVDVRSTLLQSKELALKSAVLLRVANPITLIIVLGSTLLSILLVLVAAGAGLVMLFV